MSVHERPDYRVLFLWGSLGYYSKTRDSGKHRNSFDAQSHVGIVLGRSNQTNAMIFYDPSTSKLLTSDVYRIDPSGSIPRYFPTVLYDGQLNPLVLCGGKQHDKEPFPPGTKVAVEHDGEFLSGIVTSVPIKADDQYIISFDDTDEEFSVPPNQITGEGEPVFHMMSIDPDNPTIQPPTHHQWFQNG